LATELSRIRWKGGGNGKAMRKGRKGREAKGQEGERRGNILHHFEGIDARAIQGNPDGR